MTHIIIALLDKVGVNRVNQNDVRQIAYAELMRQDSFGVNTA